MGAPVLERDQWGNFSPDGGQTWFSPDGYQVDRMSGELLTGILGPIKYDSSMFSTPSGGSGQVSLSVTNPGAVTGAISLQYDAQGRGWKYNELTNQFEPALLPDGSQITKAGTGSGGNTPTNPKIYEASGTPTGYVYGPTGQVVNWDGSPYNGPGYTEGRKDESATGSGNIQTWTVNGTVYRMGPDGKPVPFIQGQSSSSGGSSSGGSSSGGSAGASAAISAAASMANTTADNEAALLRQREQLAAQAAMQAASDARQAANAAALAAQQYGYNSAEAVKARAFQAHTQANADNAAAQRDLFGAQVQVALAEQRFGYDSAEAVKARAFTAAQQSRSEASAAALAAGRDAFAAQAAVDAATVQYGRDSAEAVKARNFQGQMQARSDALKLMTEKANYGLQRAKTELDYLALQRQTAKDYAELVGSADPGAFTRYLAVNGNLQAGLNAGPNGALSDASLAPAAQALKTLQTPFSVPTWEEATAGMDPGPWNPEAVPTAPTPGPVATPNYGGGGGQWWEEPAATTPPPITLPPAPNYQGAPWEEPAIPTTAATWNPNTGTVSGEPAATPAAAPPVDTPPVDTPPVDTPPAPRTAPPINVNLPPILQNDFGQDMTAIGPTGFPSDQGAQGWFNGMNGSGAANPYDQGILAQAQQAAANGWGGVGTPEPVGFGGGPGDPTKQAVIPMLAGGGGTRSPMMLVGERGPELVANPMMAPMDVIPNQQTEQMMRMGMRVPGYAEGTMNSALTSTESAGRMRLPTPQSPEQWNPNQPDVNKIVDTVNNALQATPAQQQPTTQTTNANPYLATLPSTVEASKTAVAPTAQWNPNNGTVTTSASSGGGQIPGMYKPLPSVESTYVPPPQPGGGYNANAGLPSMGTGPTYPQPVEPTARVHDVIPRYPGGGINLGGFERGSTLAPSAEGGSAPAPVSQWNPNVQHPAPVAQAPAQTAPPANWKNFLYQTPGFDATGLSDAQLYKVYQDRMAARVGYNPADMQLFNWNRLDPVTRAARAAAYQTGWNIPKEYTQWLPGQITPSGFSRGRMTVAA